MIFHKKDSAIGEYFSQFSKTLYLTFIVLFLFCTGSLAEFSNKSERLFQSDRDSVRINGKVTDGDEQTVLGGVSVENLRSGNGTLTNTDGEFAIAVRNGDSLQFTFIGKAPKIVVYRGESFLDVVMSKNEGALAEVVITGFQNLDKKKFAGAATSRQWRRRARAGSSRCSTCRR